MDYQLVRKRGLKRLTLRMTSKGPRVFAPKWVPKRVIDAFVESHKDQLPESPRETQERYDQYKELAREILKPIIFVWSERMGVEYNSVRIKNTRSRWGSCSSKGNLNFSFKVAFLPDHLRDYIVVHELAHLTYLDHSPRFWALVARYIPEYPAYKRELDLYAKNQKSIEYPEL